MEYSRAGAQELIRQAEPGEKIEYFRGALGKSVERSDAIRQYALVFWRAAWPKGEPIRFIYPPKYQTSKMIKGTDLGYLTQEKVGELDYRYFFTKRKGL